MDRSLKPHLTKFFECRELEKTEEEKKFEAGNGKYWNVKSNNPKKRKR